MSHEHFEVCDGCGYKIKTPSSWSEHNNPLKGWTQIRKDGGMSADGGKEFCPKCTADGTAAGYILAGFFPASGLDDSVLP